jgi:hypothetical protein
MPLDSSSSVTVAARLPDPYVHVDSRGLVLCNGPRSVCVPEAQLRNVAETFEIIADEGRATRASGPHLIGGYLEGQRVTVYAGTTDDLVSVVLNRIDFDELRVALAR